LKLKANTGMNCMHIAAKGDNPRIIHYLLQTGEFWIDMADENRCTALHWACLEGSY
jgi:ankyrin repeat protein